MAECIRGTFRSSTGETLDKRLWLPEGAPKGIVQFVHGMAEHIGRYDAPARALWPGGYLVVGHTPLGHGPKAPVQGYFAQENGWDRLLDDIQLIMTEEITTCDIIQRCKDETGVDIFENDYDS